MMECPVLHRTRTAELTRDVRPAVRSNQTAHLTAIVHSSGNPRLLERLLKGLRNSYPGLPVLAAIDQEQPEPLQEIKLVRLPSGHGASAGRNALLARVKTPFFLLLEDSHQFIRRTRLEWLLEPLNMGTLDLVVGNVACCRRKIFFRQKVERPTHGIFQVSGQRLSLHQIDENASGETVPCDLGPNFFIARTDRVRAMGGWDPELKSNEGEEFFFRASQYGLHIGYCPKASIREWVQPAVKRRTISGNHHLPVAIAKMGMTQMTQWDGTIVLAANVPVVQAAKAA
jgi:glycosyl transferase family 2